MVLPNREYPVIKLGIGALYSIVNGIPLVTYNLFWLAILFLTFVFLVLFRDPVVLYAIPPEMVIYFLVGAGPSLIFSMAAVLWIPKMRVFVRTIHVVAQLLPLVLSIFFVVFATLFAVFDVITMIALYIWYQQHPYGGLGAGWEFLALIPGLVILIILDLFASINMIYFGVAFFSALSLYLAHMSAKIRKLKADEITWFEFFTV